MKRLLIVLLMVIIIGLLGIGSYLKFGLPIKDPAPNIQIVADSALLNRGAYLANHVAVCMDCHSLRDWTRFSGPLREETLGQGGEYFGPEMGFPGKFYSKNITPTHLKTWTDGEIYRAITTGINKEGQALFPVMPYLNYGKMDGQDLISIIAYVRSLPAKTSYVAESKANFPMNFMMNSIPTRAKPMARPDSTDLISLGRYLITIAGCGDCHTPIKRGEPIASLAFSGGRPFEMPNGTVRSSNITPDIETGIGSWTDSLFISRFKGYGQKANLHPVAADELNSIMPWNMYSGMTQNDLAAIFAYLKTIQPISNSVEIYDYNLK